MSVEIRNLLKNVRILVLATFSGPDILPLPLVSGFGRFAPFKALGFRALGVNVGLMSSIRRSDMGHASPSATILAKAGSMCLCIRFRHSFYQTE